MIESSMWRRENVESTHNISEKENLCIDRNEEHSENMFHHIHSQKKKSMFIEKSIPPPPFLVFHLAPKILYKVEKLLFLKTRDN